MKRILLSISLLTMTIGHILAQGPTIKLVGGSPSLEKGTINTEVLTAIIQQKQEEVKRKVFRNAIVKGFNYSDYSSSLKNFTTYHFLYNIMDDITSGKNKTAITKAVAESSTEFAYVFGLAMYIQNSTQINKAANKVFGEFSLNENVFQAAMPEYENSNIKITNVKDFNMLIDVCYQAVMENEELQKIFKFKTDFKDKEFLTWYESDNYYKIKYSELGGDEKIELEKKPALTAEETARLAQLKTDLKPLDDYLIEVKGKLDDLVKLIEKYKNVSNQIINTANELKALKKSDLNISINEVLNSLSNLNVSDVNTKLTKLKADYSAILTSEQKTAIDNVVKLLDTDYDNYKNLINFYAGLQKSNFKDFTLSKEQYYSMKFIIVKFLEIAKNQYENNVVATVVDFMLENTLIEFSDPSGNPQPEAEATASNDKGYLYIDIESLVSAIDQKFSPTNKKGLGIYLTPFFSIGTNYASFTDSKNLLTVDNTGTPSELKNLYYASEKIGIKWKLWNWKYTHSFEVGQNFKYFNQANIINPWAWHGKKWKYADKNRRKGGSWNPFNWGHYWNPNRYWYRPQPKPLLSDIHIIAYGSGLLYNIANLKSESNFNYAVAGVGLGLTFFNGLSINASLACPYTDKKFNSDNTFFNFGLDIPIIEYIGALTKKN